VSYKTCAGAGFFRLHRCRSNQLSYGPVGINANKNLNEIPWSAPSLHFAFLYIVISAPFMTGPANNIAYRTPTNGISAGRTRMVPAM